jgi:DNA-binding NarL/FixJ family response regulator
MRLFIVDDHKDFRTTLADFLREEGMDVVLQASSLQQALEIIASGQLQEYGITVAVVDGNLGKDISCADGRTVASAIKATGLPIKVIACTSLHNPGYGDAYVNKDSITERLLPTIAN